MFDDHVDMMMFLTSCCEVDMLTLHTMYKDDTGMLHVDYISLDGGIILLRFIFIILRGTVTHTSNTMKLLIQQRRLRLHAPCTGFHIYKHAMLNFIYFI